MNRRQYKVKPKQADPTPEQITAECLLIQSEWSASERWSRMRSDMRPTFIRCDGVRQEFTHDAYDQHIEGQWSPELSGDDFDLPAD